MDTSLLVARIAAVAYISMALGMALSPDYYKHELAKLMDNAGFKFLAGFMALVLGMLIVAEHNLWESNWTVLVTLIGWISLLKGVMLLVLPNAMGPFKKLLKGENMRKIVSPLCWVLGLIFVYFGFVA